MNVLELGVDPQKIITIYNGRKIPENSTKLGDIKKSPFTLGIISTIAQNKGQHIFALGASELLKKYPDMEFHIYGDIQSANEKYVNKLKDIILESACGKRIIFKGFVVDIEKKMRKLNLACYLTIDNEPLGAMVEAMMNSIPVIATDTGGIPEVITHRENGWLIKPDSIDEFVKAVEHLYQNPSLMKRLAMNGYEFAIQNLSSGAYVCNVERVYENVFSVKV